MRDRLIEVIGNSHCVEIWDYYNDCFKDPCPIEKLADHLLANGVIVPPCKVGEKVYYFSHRPFNLSVLPNTIYEAYVVRIVTTRLGTSLVIQILNEYGCTEIPDIRSWGISVFATKEEAELALKGGAEE